MRGQEGQSLTSDHTSSFSKNLNLKKKNVAIGHFTLPPLKFCYANKKGKEEKVKISSDLGTFQVPR